MNDCKLKEEVEKARKIEMRRNKAVSRLRRLRVRYIRMLMEAEDFGIIKKPKRVFLFLKRCPECGSYLENVYSTTDYQLLPAMLPNCVYKLYKCKCCDYKYGKKC